MATRVTGTQTLNPAPLAGGIRDFRGPVSGLKGLPPQALGDLPSLDVLAGIFCVGWAGGQDWLLGLHGAGPLQVLDGCLGFIEPRCMLGTGGFEGSVCALRGGSLKTTRRDATIPAGIRSSMRGLRLKN